MATYLNRELHVPMFVGAMVEQLYNYAVSQGGEDDYHTTNIKFMRIGAASRLEAKKEVNYHGRS